MPDFSGLVYVLVGFATCFVVWMIFFSGGGN